MSLSLPALIAAQTGLSARQVPKQQASRARDRKRPRQEAAAHPRPDRVEHEAVRAAGVAPCGDLKEAPEKVAVEVGAAGCVCVNERRLGGFGVSEGMWR